MAPSRCATSITWSVGTKRNSASLSTNFLMSQGQATRSTLTRSRVIHFIAGFSFWLHRIASTAKRTKIDAKRDGLSHLAFLIDGNTTTGQKDVEALPQCIKGSGVRPQLGLDLLIDPHARGVDHVDHTWVLDGHIEPRCAVIMPDGIRRTCNRHLGQLQACGGVQRHDRTPVAGDEGTAAILVQVQPVWPNARDGKLPGQFEGRGRDHRHQCWFANIDKKTISRLLGDRPTWSPR